MSFRHPYEKPEAELLVVRFERDFLDGTYGKYNENDLTEKLTSGDEVDFE